MAASPAAPSLPTSAAEHCLLRAYFLEPEHLTVLVALYRCFYYRHRYAESLLVAERAIALTGRRLGVGPDWRRIDAGALGPATLTSMSLTRFLLLATKGAGSRFRSSPKGSPTSSRFGNRYFLTDLLN